MGLDCGYEGNMDLEGDRPKTPAERTGWHTIRRNVVSDNGAAGILGAGAHDCVIRHNVLERNNHRDWGAPEMGAVKLHFCDNTLIEGNLFRDNECDHNLYINGVHPHWEGLGTHKFVLNPVTRRD